MRYWKLLRTRVRLDYETEWENKKHYGWRSISDWIVHVGGEPEVVETYNSQSEALAALDEKECTALFEKESGKLYYEMTSYAVESFWKENEGDEHPDGSRWECEKTGCDDRGLFKMGEVRAYDQKSGLVIRLFDDKREAREFGRKHDAWELRTVRIPRLPWTQPEPGAGWGWEDIEF